LQNVALGLEEDREAAYLKMTRMIARTINTQGPDAPEAISLYLRWPRLLNLSPARAEITPKLAAAHRQERVLIFHENVEPRIWYLQRSRCHDPVRHKRQSAG
jgi:hypothetical protein